MTCNYIVFFYLRKHLKEVFNVSISSERQIKEIDIDVCNEQCMLLIFNRNIKMFENTTKL